jgi:hypothetical protein
MSGSGEGVMGNHDSYSDIFGFGFVSLAARDGIGAVNWIKINHPIGKELL